MECVHFVEKHPNEKSRFSKRWTDEEKRYLISHKTDGAELIAAALGRTIISIQIMACRLHVSLERIESELCPRCGKYRMRKGTSGYRHGLCPVCWEQEKAYAIRERKAFQRARQDYERAKKE